MFRRVGRLLNSKVSASTNLRRAFFVFSLSGVGLAILAVVGLIVAVFESQERVTIEEGVVAELCPSSKASPFPAMRETAYGGTGYFDSRSRVPDSYSWFTSFLPVGLYVQFHRCTQLHVLADRIEPSQLQAISELSHLEHVSITGPATLSSNLSALAPLEHLYMLELVNVKVDPIPFDEMSWHSDLDTLVVSGTGANDHTLSGLPELESLVSLYARDADIGDGLGRELFEMSSLRGLDLGGCGKISDGIFAAIPRDSRLRSLYLERTSVTDSGLVHLGELGSLEELSLAHTLVTGAGLSSLAGLTNLVVLDLSGLKVDDDSLTHLAGLTRLVELNLSGTEITEQGIVHLRGLRNLRYLGLAETEIRSLPEVVNEFGAVDGPLEERHIIIYQAPNQIQLKDSLEVWLFDEKDAAWNGRGPPLSL